MTVAADIEAAAALIEVWGWWAGPIREPGRRAQLCEVQALAKATNRMNGGGVSYIEARRAMATFVGVSPDLLHYWNDEQVDGEFVVNTMRKCAAELRAQEVLDVDA